MNPTSAVTEREQRLHEARAHGLWLCDYCNAVAYERNCKVICPNCGRYRDCGDLFDTP